MNMNKTIARYRLRLNRPLHELRLWNEMQGLRWSWLKRKWMEV